MSNIRIFTSSWMHIHDKLDLLSVILRAQSYPVDEALLPGLSRDEITDMVRDLPFPVPEEVYQLYTWRNGTKIDAGLELFGSHVFIPLERALSESKAIEHTGSPRLSPSHN